MPDRAHASDGLTGEWLSLEQLGELDFFRSGKRAFKIKLATNFAPAAGSPEPGIKAAVKREYQPGAVICKAGEYGSTAFLLLEGAATATLGDEAAPRAIAGRSAGSLARWRDLFTRRTRRPAAEPTLSACGEVSPYASLSPTRPPAPLTLGPGDVFGVDTCINFFPREATVRAATRCVVLEMLRAVLDSVRDAGEAGPKVEAAYATSAVRHAIALAPWLGDLRDADREALAAEATLLTPEADEIGDGVVYGAGAQADAVYLVRSGTIKLAQQRPGGELIFAYLGRGAAFGFEPVLAARPQLPPQLVCVEPAGALAAVELSGSVTVGRKASCQVRLPATAAGVGREHCRFEVRDGELFLTDLDSRNFTLLNGERIREAIVRPGDRVTVVDHTFEIARPDVDASAVAQPPLRLATASGLDNFEIVRLPGRLLRRLSAANADFQRALAAIASGANAPTAAGPPDPRALPELTELNLYNSQNTLLIDLDRCTRCDECVRACADAHGGVTRLTRDGPRFGKYLVTLACRSCTDPKCMIGCPVGSIRREGSLEIRIEDWCIGCQRCANQCPFGNINMIELAASPAAPAPKPAAAPTVVPLAIAAAPALRATVCDLCAGYDEPNCVYACPHDAAIRVHPASFLSAEDLR